MNIRSDWHIHTHNSCDDASLTMSDLLSGAAAAGITDFGVTDHLHTPFNLPDIIASRREFDSVSPGPSVHFGIEVSVVSEWELGEIAAGKHENPVYGVREGGPPAAAMALGLKDDDRSRLGIEYVVGGTHWPLYVEWTPEAIIADYHRQNMFLATHSMVDIVAHPWWWMGRWQDPATGMYLTYPWLDDFGRIPSSMHDEFAAAVVASGKKVEINIGAMILNPGYSEKFKRQYVEYLALLQEKGVALCAGSDCHSVSYDPDWGGAQEILETGGVDLSGLWMLQPRLVRM